MKEELYFTILKTKCMSGDPKKRRLIDSSRINIHEPWELQYWSEKLGVSKDQIIEVVNAMGTSAAANDTLHKLNHIIKEAIDRNYTADQFKQEVEILGKEASVLSKFLPKNFADIMAFLTLVATIISFIVANKQQGNTITNNNIHFTISNETNNRLIQDSTEDKKRKK
jgi:hypothetical protein